MATRFSTGVIGKAAKGRSRILDAGCGTGAQTFYLARQNPSRLVCGYDMSQEAIDKARVYRERLRVTNAEFTVANHDDFMMSYLTDMIYTSGSLLGENDVVAYRHNFADGEEIVRRRLSRFRNMLKENGIYVIIWCANSVANDGFIRAASDCGFRFLQSVLGACLDIEFRQDPVFENSITFGAI